jgi:sigma-B regulation protein RsbU (phosphoserine phosphatase)
MEKNEVPEPMPRNAVRDAVLQKRLMARRERLREALPALPNAAPLHPHRHEEIENDRLLTDPLCRNCLDHLSASEQRALERDLDLAFQVQSGLLPKPGVAAHGWTMAYHYRPAGPVSGDYCDLIRLEDGSALFLLGDVMGKGVAASMLTAHLHAIFRSLATPARPMNELVAKANRVFCEGTIASFYATLVCGRLGTDGDVEVCNAGHCYPLHLHQGTVSPIEATGLPLGLFCDAEYTSHRKKFPTGDGLVIHSDGLSETFNKAGVQYGVERLSELLRRQRAVPPGQLLAALLEDLDGFRTGAPVTDDLTVMVIRREV